MEATEAPLNGSAPESVTRQKCGDGNDTKSGVLFWEHNVFFWENIYVLLYSIGLLRPLKTQNLEVGPFILKV